MNRELILYPLFAQVLLVMLVWIYMYWTRIGEIRRKNIDPQQLADQGEAGKLLKSVTYPSENLINLFEMPVLFYTAVLLAYMLDKVSAVLLACCWLFVVLRYAHSFIHVTYNKIMHRFTAYFASTVMLWAAWIVIAFTVLW